MSSPIQIYFANLKQEHLLDDIVVIEDRSPSIQRQRKVVMPIMDTTSDESSCEMTQPVATEEKAPMKTHISNTKPIPRPVRMKIAATTA